MSIASFIIRCNLFFGRNTPSECFFSSLRMQSYKKNSIFAVKRSIKLYKIVEAVGRYHAHQKENRPM